VDAQIGAVTINAGRLDRGYHACTNDGTQGWVAPDKLNGTPFVDVAFQPTPGFTAATAGPCSSPRRDRGGPPTRLVAHDRQRGGGGTGVLVEGICLYPGTDYSSWVDARHCPTGLLGYVGANGSRPKYEPLALEVATQERTAAEPGRGKPVVSLGCARTVLNGGGLAQ
jgi:hypothetical protein